MPPLPSEVVAQAKTDFREMVAAKTRADLSTAGFFQKLSPQQQGKLVDVITKNETDLMQRLTEAAEKGKVLSEGDFAALRGDGEQSIKSMLSASEYSDYQQHALSAPDRNILAQTSQVLGRSLSEESSEGLLSLLAQERQNMLSNPPQNGQELTQAVAGMAERVNARAATVLTSDQERQALQQVLSGLVEGASKKPPGR